jgi:hypothetical protein
MNITTRNLIERADLSDSIRELILKNSHLGAILFNVIALVTISLLIILSIVF